MTQTIVTDPVSPLSSKSAGMWYMVRYHKSKKLELSVIVDAGPIFCGLIGRTLENIKCVTFKDVVPNLPQLYFNQYSETYYERVEDYKKDSEYARGSCTGAMLSYKPNIYNIFCFEYLVYFDEVKDLSMSIGYVSSYTETSEVGAVTEMSSPRIEFGPFETPKFYSSEGKIENRFEIIN